MHVFVASKAPLAHDLGRPAAIRRGAAVIVGISATRQVKSQAA